MKTLKTLYKTEIIMILREFSGVFFGVMLPVGLILLLGIIYGDKPAFEGASYTLMEQSVAAVLTIGICATGLMGIPITVSSYREKKLLKRLEISPVSPRTLIVVQFLSHMTIAVLSSFFVIFIAVIVFNYSMTGSKWQFLVAYLLVTFSTYSLGILIASLSKSVKMSNLLCSLIYFPTFFLSGGTIPYEIMPNGLKNVASIIPLTQGIKILKGVSLGNALSHYVSQSILLLFIGIICIIISIRTFRYDY